MRLDQGTPLTLFFYIFEIIFSKFSGKRNEIGCRYHGGKSTGAKNPRTKHGYYTKKSIAERKWLNELIQEANEIASEINGQSTHKGFIGVTTRTEKREYIPLDIA